MKEGTTTLMRSCSSKHIEIVRELIERGADINTKTKGKKRMDKEKQH